MGENIKLRQIIMGMRDEYLKNFKELQKLKKYLYVMDRRIDDYYLEVKKQFSEIDPDLVIYYQVRRNKIQNIIKKLEEKLDVYPYGIDEGHFYHRFNNEDTYFVSGKYNATVTDDRSFDQGINKILESDFIRNITTSCKLSSFDILDFNPQFIDYKNVNDNSSILINYSVYDDTVNFSKGSSASDIYVKINQDIPTAKLNNYHQEIIKNNDKTYYDMDFMIDNIYDLGGKYKIYEDNKKFVLIKKKK